MPDVVVVAFGPRLERGLSRRRPLADDIDQDTPGEPLSVIELLLAVHQREPVSQHPQRTLAEQCPHLLLGVLAGGHAASSSGRPRTVPRVASVAPSRASVRPWTALSMFRSARTAPRTVPMWWA